MFVVNIRRPAEALRYIDFSALSGNLTLTGSVANIIVVEQSRGEAEISFKDYFKVGLPITLLTLGFGSLWLWWIR